MSNPIPSHDSSGHGPPQRLKARRIWWMVLLLVIAWLSGLLLLFNFPMEFRKELGVGIAGTPAAPMGFESQTAFPYSPFNGETQGYLFHAGIYLAVFFLTQWLFLASRGGMRIRLEEEGRSMKRSAVAAACIAMLVSIGLLAVLLEFPFPAKVNRDNETPWGRLIIYRPYVIWAAMLLLWAAWGAIFWIYSRSLDRHTAITRIFKWLFAGTILELLVAAPAHAWVARREDCYCARGSWTGLVFGTTALLWLFGPGIFLLLLREKRRLQRTK